MSNLSCCLVEMLDGLTHCAALGLHGDYHSDNVVTFILFQMQ